MIRLMSGQDYYRPTSWCLTNLSRLSSSSSSSSSRTDNETFLSWDGASAALVDSFSLQLSAEVSVEQHHLVQAVLVCGGASSDYQVSAHCVWWSPLTRTATPGPSMARPRYQAATVTRPGLVWILGSTQSPPQSCSASGGAGGISPTTEG